MKAPITFLETLTCQVGDEIKVPLSIKEMDNGIISFDFDIRIDSEFLEFKELIPNELFIENSLGDGIEYDYSKLEGADKPDMMKLHMHWQGTSPISNIGNTTVCNLIFKAIKNGMEYLKFLNDIPKFPDCDCLYYGEDGIMMDETVETYNNGKITIDLAYAPVTKLPKIDAKVGDIIECPITTTGMNDISAITLHLKFDNKILKYVKTVLSDELAVEGRALYNCVDMKDYGMWILAWSQLKPISQKEDESLVILQFECVGKGTSDLIWMLEQNEYCEYADKNAQVLPETDFTYVNGYVNSN